MTGPLGPVGEPIIEHYNDPENLNKVGDRFAVYEYATPRVDLHDAQVKVLGGLGLLAPQAEEQRVVCDVGSGKGDIYKRLLSEGFDGSYIAIDRSANQFKLSKSKVLFLAANALFVNGAADRLPVRSGSVDVALANFVLYHEYKEERQQTFHELARILKESGVIGLATSGVLNKSTQRQFERRISTRLHIAPPPEMNTNWTSEIADEEIAANFPDWNKYDFHQRGYFVISDEEKVDVSIQSVRTSRDLYSPAPDRELFEAELAELREDLLTRIDDGYPAVDNIDRTFHIISRQKLDLPPRTLLG